MKKIINKEMLSSYIKEYNINSFFGKDIEDNMELFSYEKRDIICRENEKIMYMYIFVKGKAKVLMNLKNGKSLLVCFCWPLDILGDVELMNNETASATVEAIEETHCIAISLDKLKESYLTDDIFLKFICSSLSDKLKRSSKNSSINLLYPLENRLASYILATNKSIHRNDIKLYENLTEVSELLGVSYRHLLRVINEFCNKGIIKKENKIYHVINYDKLISLSADLYG